MPNDMFPFVTSSTGQSIVVDSSGFLIVNGNTPVSGLIYSFGTTGRPLVVDASGRLLLSAKSVGIGNGGNSSINGTPNTIAQFISSNEIGDSIITSSGTFIGIDIGAPSEKLQVGGNIQAVSGVYTGDLSVDGSFTKNLIVLGDLTARDSILSGRLTAPSGKIGGDSNNLPSGVFEVEGKSHFISHESSTEAFIAERTSTGTGHAAKVKSSANIPCFQVDQDGNGNALHIDHDGAGGNALLVDHNNGADAFLLNKGADGKAFHIIGPAGATSQMVDFNVDTTAEAFFVENNGSGVVCRFDSDHVTGTSSVLELFNAGGGKYIDTDAGAGTPAHLSNDGVWTDASCWKHLKENFEPVNEKHFLQKIAQMEFAFYDKKGSKAKKEKTFSCFQDDLVKFGFDGHGINNFQVASLALCGLKALYKENQELRRRVEELENNG